MINLCLFVLLATVPFVEPLADRVSQAERNEFYDCEGRLVFVQWIFSDELGRIQAWRLEKDFIRQWHPPALIWLDEGRVRRVTAGSWVETANQVDREVSQREVFPKELRRGLRGERR